jgi:hypothetical protein
MGLSIMVNWVVPVFTQKNDVEDVSIVHGKIKQDAYSLKQYKPMNDRGK